MSGWCGMTGYRESATIVSEMRGGAIWITVIAIGGGVAVRIGGSIVSASGTVSGICTDDERSCGHGNNGPLIHGVMGFGFFSLIPLGQAGGVHKGVWRGC